MRSVTPSPASLSADQMADALTAAAGRSELQRAATHLLIYTDLPGRADFARHVTLDWEETEGTRTLTARVDWAALRDDESIYLSGGPDRLLNLAISYAKGRPVHLDAYLNSFGTEHARRVIEAHIIGLGMEGFFTIADGPKLVELRAFHDELLNG